MNRPTTWRDAVAQKLRDRPRDLTLDAVAFDLKVSVRWLKTLIATKPGDSFSPTINAMEALDRYLNERE